MRSAPTVFIDAAHNPAGAQALAAALAEEFDFRYLVGVLAVLGDKDVDGILAALEPVFDQVVVTDNGSPRALDVETLALRAEERVRPGPGGAGRGLPDAIETATALVEERVGDGYAGAGIVITGSVVTAGVARTLFGKDPAMRRTPTTPAAPDPWKSFRGVMAGTLILEVIAVLLALPVVSDGRRRAHALGPRPTCWASPGCWWCSPVCRAGPGRSGPTWPSQLLLVLGFFVYPAIGFIGVLFGVVWGVIAYLRAEVRAAPTARPAARSAAAAS